MENRRKHKDIMLESVGQSYHELVSGVFDGVIVCLNHPLI